MSQIIGIIKNPIVTLLIGLIATIIAYKKGQSNRRPLWDMRTFNLISNFNSKLSKVEVLYDKGKVQNLSISRLIFWNEGKREIVNSDISKMDRLRIVTQSKDIRILDAEVLALNASGSTFNINLDIENNEVTLDFDYLNTGKGAVIQIIHAGVYANDLMLKGEIIGVNKIKRRFVLYNSTLAFNILPKFLQNKLGVGVKRKLNSLLYLCSAVLIFVILGLLLSLAKGITMQLLYVVSILLSCGSMVALGIKNWRRQIPKGLEVFEKEIW
jgi:hypothetical protein